MQCQTCPLPATGIATLRGFRVRCCSVDCARTLTTGIHSTVPGTVYVAAASPLGSVIGAKLPTAHAGYTLPEKVAAQLVGALQRIGPKRPASSADAALPPAKESGQEGIDWSTSLPYETWAQILPMLGHVDLGNFAATSKAANDLRNMDVVQAEKYRQTRTPFTAAVQYMKPSTPINIRTIIRRAYPNVAEMALALMLVHASEANYSMGFMTAQSLATWFNRMRREAGLRGDALFQRPIVLPFRGPKLVNSLIVSDGTVLVTATALLEYFYHLPMRTLPMTTLAAQLHNATWTAALFGKTSASPVLYETPETVSFYSIPHIADFHMTMYSEHAGANFDELIAGGVDMTRRDAPFWLAYVSHELGFVRSAYMYVRNSETIRFDRPRTTGQLSHIEMANFAQAPAVFYRWLIGFLDLHNELYGELLADAYEGAADELTCMFKYLEMADESFTQIVEAASRIQLISDDDPPVPLLSPFLVRSAADETPFEYYLRTLDLSELEIVIGAAENTPLGSMVWDPFCRRPGAADARRRGPALADMPYDAQVRLTAAIIANTDPDLFDTRNTMRYISLLLQQVNDFVARDQDVPQDLITLVTQLLNIIPADSTFAVSYAWSIDPDMPAPVQEALGRFLASLPPLDMPIDDPGFAMLPPPST